jgi:glycosyltransferase involved in cell wall biosynthesis
MISTAGRPWLSVVMPTYNGADYLADALESIVQQHDDGLEVIAVDDGSTDATLEILAGFAQRLPMQIVRRAHVGNWVANTNLGMSLADAPYVSILHQDDYWLPGRLHAIKPLVEAHCEAVLFLHPARFVDHRGRTLGSWRCPLTGHANPLPPAWVLPRLLVQNFVAMPSPLFRRDTFLAVDGMKEPLWYTADWDLWLSLAAAGPTVYCPQTLACFRVHAQSQTVRASLANDLFRRQIEEVFGDHLRRYESCHGPLPRVAHRAARFSIDVNAALAAFYHGHRAALAALLARLLVLGPQAAYVYFRDSRIWERLVARMRLGGR